MTRRSLGLLALALLAGCAGGLYDFPTDPGTTASCRSLMQELPNRVLDQTSTPVDSDRVAAWGDPRVVLRCGIQEPSALRPTSRCDDVDGIGWFTQKRDGGQVFSTIGRDPDVSVEVPSGYDAAGGALIDVADAVKSSTKAVKPCV